MFQLSDSQLCAMAAVAYFKTILYFLLPKTFNRFGFKNFRLLENLVKVISETRRAHYIRYLRFYSKH